MKSPKNSGATVTRFSEMESLPVDWLWLGWIPLGMLSVFDGDPGLGKSTLLTDLAARLSRGDVMPDGSPGPEASGVVLLSAEDSLDRVIRPRLIAAGADVARVATVQLPDGEGGLRDPTLAREDLAEVESEMKKLGAKLLILDPLTSFLPRGMNSCRDQDMRRGLRRLSDLAQRTGAAVVVVRHLNKGKGGNALYRGGGSIGIIAAARAGLMLTRDPSDHDARVLATTKANLAPAPVGLRLRLVSDAPESAPRVSWEGESDQTAASLLADGGERSAVDDAVDLLREVLSAGPVPSLEVMREAKEVGVSWASVKCAKRRLGGPAVKTGGGWVWTLPGQDVQGAQQGGILAMSQHRPWPTGRCEDTVQPFEPPFQPPQRAA